MFSHELSASLGLRLPYPHEAFTPPPCFTARLPQLLPVATSEQLCSTTAEQPSPPACSHLQPGGSAAQGPRGMLAPSCAPSPAAFALSSRLGFFLAHLQKSQARLSTVHIQHAKPTSLLFNLNPKACRGTISMLERRFLEFSCCCQIQLASGLLKQLRNLPRQPGARETCAWANLSMDKHWPVEPEPRTQHPQLKLTPS